MEGRLQVFPAALLVMMLLLFIGGVRGDAVCDDQKQDCYANVTAASTRVTGMFTDQPLNVTAIVTQCQAMEQVVASCEADLPTVCGVTPSLNSSLELYRSVYNSVCGPETLCPFYVVECSMTTSDISDITSLLGQSSPNVQLAKEKCSALNATRTPCMERLKADCSGQPTVSSSIEADDLSFNSVCGEEPLCQAQLARCSALIRSNDPFQLCSSKQAISDCFAELDPVCHTLSYIRQTIDGINTSLLQCPGSGQSTDQCPQVWQCITQTHSRISDSQCSWSGNMVGCVAGLKGICPMTEEYMTFQEIGVLNQQFCQEISKVANVSHCEMMGDCVLGSELMRQLTNTSTSTRDRISLMLDSQMWCRYLDLVAECYMKSSSSCSVDPTLLSYMTRQHSYLKTACYSSGAHGGKAALGNSILILLLAVLTTWGQSFL